jgi:hypothetical protein
MTAEVAGDEEQPVVLMARTRALQKVDDGGALGVVCSPSLIDNVLR